ncbi:MAG TPA: amino acid adenylation domain-containing protein [Usitatibacter sp.]|nr:amino acid adenylation domain-containing protein [Usitatibacter sp.]
MASHALPNEAVAHDPFASGAELSGVVPTTEAQREVWLADRLGREASLAYNESISLRLHGALREDGLRDAVQDLADRHELLRATLSPTGEEILIAASMPIEVPCIDLSGIAADEREARLAAASARAVQTPFELERGPLLRAQLFRLAPDDHVLILTAHHIVCDGWSFGVIVHDLACLYARRVDPADAPCEPAARFSDYVVAQCDRALSAEHAQDERFWLSRFDGVPPVLDLPTDRPRPAVRTFASRREDFVLDTELVASVRRAGAKQGASFFATLLAGFAALMHRLSGAQDMVIGIPSAGQATEGFATLVGHCVNLLPVRLAVDPAAGADALIAAAQSTMLDAQEHNGYTFGTLLRKLPLERDAGRLPLVSVMFNLDQPIDTSRLGFPGLSAELASNPRSYENFELFVNAVQAGDGLRLECQYNSDLFDAATVKRWLSVYERLLRSLCAAVATPVGRLQLTTEDERAQLARWNDTTRDYDRTTPVHALVESRARLAGAGTAIAWRDETWSYAELEAYSNRIARALRAQGVARGMRVGLHLGRGPRMVAALLGVLKSGAAYVPLDPAYPQARLSFMAQDAALAVLITDCRADDAFATSHGKRLHLDADAASIEAEPSGPLVVDARSAQPMDPAYVIYTSGSTGKPKGVQVPHRAVANFLASMAHCPGLSADDRVLAVTTLSFDIAVNELLLPLSVGAQIVLASTEEASDGTALGRLMSRHAVTVMQATPATWRLLLESGWNGMPKLRALCGGETLARALARELLVRTGELWNMYGPTETTVWSTCARVHDAESLSIGRPIANTQVWIRDAAGEPCPIGVPGEICIGGDGVTLGYLDRPELTRDRFVQDPYGEPGACLYRTGDRGRWRVDGVLEHLGRLDSQVKVRGFRIELGEIESGLAAIGGVRDAVAIVREDRPGDPRLVAYVVADAGAGLDDEALRTHLQRVLPAYMVPQHFVTLRSIPRLPNGKVDRRGLPPPSAAASEEGFVAPRSDLEKAVAAEFESVLGLPDVGVRDDFFMLGGHSLMAAQLATRLSRAFATDIAMRTIFAAPTIELLAREIASRSEGGAATPGPVQRLGDRTMAPASAAQERLWYFHEVNPGRITYNTPSAHRLRGKLDQDAFQRAFDEMVRRQATLRTRFEMADAGLVQRIEAPFSTPLFPAEDLSVLPPEERELRLAARIDELLCVRFDLTKLPLFVVRMFRLGPEEHVLFFMPHHIVWDGWSFDILYTEMSAMYGAFREGLPNPLPELPIGYGDFAAWHRKLIAGTGTDEQMAFWKGRLRAPLPMLDVPLDRPHARAAEAGGWMQVKVGAATVEGIHRLGRRLNASPFMVTLAAYASILHQWTGQCDLVIGVPTRSRNSEELEGVMGLFVNPIPVRLQFDPGWSFAQLVAHVRDRIVEALQNPDVPFDRLVRELDVPREPGRFPLYQTMFSFQDARERAVRWGNLEHGVIRMPLREIAEDISLWVMERDGQLSGALAWSAGVAAATASLLNARFVRTLERATGDPGFSLRDLVFADEEPTFLAQWNDTARGLDFHESLASRLGALARAHPLRRALRCGDAQLTYEQLQARADGIAATLRSRGVGHGSRVGICLRRGPDMVASILAVLSTGAAYLPLDPAYPASRLAFMAEDAAVGAIVCDESLQSLPEHLHGLAVRIDVALPASGAEGVACHPVAPGDCAYIMYTSGSTGRPKAVMVPHRALSSFLSSMLAQPGITAEDRLVAVTTLSFDIAVLELFLPLIVGAEVVMATRDEASDAHRLMQLIDRSSATMMQATPATWRMLVEHKWQAPTGFRALVGGEALPAELAAELLETVGELWNMYGPTETTVWSTCGRILDPAFIHIGRPIGNTRVYVLDENGRSCPIGVRGELWIAGDGVALGYLNQPELTAERFKDDPFAGEDGQRMYRTGDVGRWHPDGVLVHLGRNDQQIKMRGFRIELGEIGAALESHPAVARSVAAVREMGPGDQRLVAFYVARDASATSADLADHLRTILPPHMLPQHLVALPEIPLLPNGKVDRRALDSHPLEAATPEPRAGRPPATPTEMALAEVWKQLCGVSQVTADDLFFDLGGHSLLAMQAILRMERLTGRRIDPNRYVFESLAQIALAYDEEARSPVARKRGMRGMLASLVGAARDS